MQYEWPKKLKKLETLTNYIEEFFRKEGFVVETIPRNDDAKIRIMALPTQNSKVEQALRIEVAETPSGTTVDFVSSTRADESIRLGVLSQFLAGGTLLARSAKVKEKTEALETKFWNSLQEFIAYQQGQLT